MKAWCFGLALACFSLLTTRSAADQGETYYMAVFASQRPGVNWPKYAHSFALFVRATPCGPDGAPRFDSVVISWLPRTQDVSVLTIHSEPGHNFDLESSVHLAHSLGARISLWGPYQIRGELYDLAVAQKERLEGGAVRYKAIDVGLPADRISNCIRAVSQVAPGGPKLCVGAPSWGEPASYFLTLAFRPWILDTERTHDWVLQSQHLPECTLLRRRLDQNPCEVPLLRAVQDLRNRALLPHRR